MGINGSALTSWSLSWFVLQISLTPHYSLYTLYLDLKAPLPFIFGILAPQKTGYLGCKASFSLSRWLYTTDIKCGKHEMSLKGKRHPQKDCVEIYYSAHVTLNSCLWQANYPKTKKILGELKSQGVEFNNSKTVLNHQFTKSHATRAA